MDSAVPADRLSPWTRMDWRSAPRLFTSGARMPGSKGSPGPAALGTAPVGASLISGEPARPPGAGGPEAGPWAGPVAEDLAVGGAAPRRAVGVGTVGEAGRGFPRSATALGTVSVQGSERADSSGLSVLATDGGVQMAAPYRNTFREREQRRVKNGVPDLAAAEGAPRGDIVQVPILHAMLGRKVQLPDGESLGGLRE